MSLAHALAAQAMAQRSPRDPTDKTHAGMKSKIRRAVAALDEEKAFFWEPGGFLTVVTTEDAEYFELPWQVRIAQDDWSEIDKRLAEAYYETQTFADFLGLP